MIALSVNVGTELPHSHQHTPRLCPFMCRHNVLQVKQSVLVRDVLRAVQGLKGTYMTYNSHQQQQHQQQGGSHAAAAVPSPADCSAGLRVASQAQVIKEGGTHCIPRCAAVVAAVGSALTASLLLFQVLCVRHQLLVGGLSPPLSKPCPCCCSLSHSVCYLAGTHFAHT